MDLNNTLTILYGSRSGNSKSIALLAYEYASHLGIDAQLESMDSMDFQNLATTRNLLVAVSTHGEGEPPVAAEDFHSFIHSTSIDLSSCRYAVVGLGDSSYRYYCQTGVDIDQQLEKLGALRQLELEKCDIDFEEKSKQWIKKAVNHFANSLEKRSIPTSDNFVFELKLEDDAYGNAFKAKVLKRELLNGKDAAYPTLNLTLSIKDSGLLFHPGDTVGIYATNSRLLVDKLCKHLGFDPSHPVQQKDQLLTLKDALIHHFELTQITPVMVKKYAVACNNALLNALILDKKTLQDYTKDRNVLDLVIDYPGQFKVEVFLSILRKLMPRYYSAASFTSDTPDQVDITLRIVDYKKDERRHEGVCSSFLSVRVEEGESIPIFIEHNERFRLPEQNNDSVIMISAGTGIAPFRSFLQYRKGKNASGKNWLFFGERNSKTDFFYQDEILDYKHSGLLTKLNTTFSRDQDKKNYIYHSLLEQGKEVYDWIQSGAKVFICGNKRTMANDVKLALTDIISKNSGVNTEEATAYLEQMRQNKTLQEDIY